MHYSKLRFPSQCFRYHQGIQPSSVLLSTGEMLFPLVDGISLLIRTHTNSFNHPNREHPSLLRPRPHSSPCKAFQSRLSDKLLTTSSP
ncbi:hypothetical protein DPV78_004092 [Talaromyces pinophilus]|nr:hypothetical protein DPV78_004092 [Talaromyces pinophilus]